MSKAHHERNWQWIVAGILLVLFGLVALFFPGLTLGSMAFMVGAAFLLSGIVNIVTYWRDRGILHLSCFVLAYGIADVLVGLIFTIHPMLLAAVLLWLMGISVIVFGGYELVGAFLTRKGGFSLWGWLLFSGVVSIAIGILFMTFPAFVAICIGVFAIMRGVSLIVLGANSWRFV